MELPTLSLNYGQPEINKLKTNDDKFDIAFGVIHFFLFSFSVDVKLNLIGK